MLPGQFSDRYRGRSPHRFCILREAQEKFSQYEENCGYPPCFHLLKYRPTQSPSMIRGKCSLGNQWREITLTFLFNSWEVTLHSCNNWMSSFSLSCPVLWLMLCVIVRDLLIIYNSAVKQEGFWHYSEWECDEENDCKEEFWFLPRAVWPGL